MRMLRVIALLTLAGVLSGCQDSSVQVKPVAITMTEEAVGHYCQMYLFDHGGPKAQIHLKNIAAPIWFAQVSDAVAYLRDPEQMAEIAAVYVTDMSKAPSWSDVGTNNWIDADAAFFVIESKQMGGMSTPEALPFSTREAADALVQTEGGNVIALAGISEAYVRSAGSIMQDMGADDAKDQEHSHADK